MVPRLPIAARRVRLRRPISPPLALLGLAAAGLLLLVLPFLMESGWKDHLTFYWEATGAPLVRWARLETPSAGWLVSNLMPQTARDQGMDPAMPAAGGPGSGTGERRSWLAALASRLPHWMLMSELAVLRPGSPVPASGGAAAPLPEAGASEPARGAAALEGRPDAPAPGTAPGEGSPEGRLPAALPPAREGPAAPPDLPGGGQPLVLLYHSHTSEMYHEAGEPLREASSYHRFNSTETGVVQAGRVLARALEGRGVPVLHDTGIYDYPSHPNAYQASGKAVAEILQQFPSVRAVIDLHRDTPADMTVTVDGRRVARITLVVATAVDSPLSHPHWRENLAFAQELARVMNARTPGLLDRILQVPNRRYNQELHPHALLVELGSYHNTQAEAEAAAELLAESLASVVLASEPPARPQQPGSPDRP